MDPIGKSPVPTPVLIFGKLAFLGSLMFFLVKGKVADTLLFDSVFTETVDILLAIAGLLLLVLGFVYLGRSLSLGLPEESTELKTRGVFRITRNPLYLGVFLACVGSCLYSIHIVNILFCATAVVIHHRIILKEEEFLEKRFGQQWSDYKNIVPRYLWRFK